MRKLILFFVLLSLHTNAIAKDEMPQEVLDALRNLGIPQSAVSLYSFNLSQEKLISQFGANIQRNPASVMKLVTSLAALEILGPAYQWKTQVYTTNPFVGPNLNGDLIFKGFGDPKLNLESFWMLLNKIRSRGIKNIRGNVILDRSFFKVPYHDPAAFDGNPHRPYNLGPDALMVNFRAININFIPDKKSKKINIHTVPKPEGLQIINKLRMTRRACWSWPDKPKIKNNQIIFQGAFSQRCGQKQRSYTLQSADDYFSSIFRQIWTSLGGTLTGNVKPGLVRDSDKLLITHSSKTLVDTLKDINKFSNNAMARQVYLTLGSLTKKIDISSSDAEKQFKVWFKTTGIPDTNLIIDNGSGLSRTSRISAQAVGKILQHAWKNPLMPEFVSSLPLLAIDGTLRKKLRRTALAGKGHLKTGYIKGVRTIAGYLVNKNNDTTVVVLFINHPKAKISWPVHEEFLKWVYAKT